MDAASEELSEAQLSEYPEEEVVISDEVFNDGYASAESSTSYSSGSNVDEDEEVVVESGGTLATIPEKEDELSDRRRREKSAVISDFELNIPHPHIGRHLPGPLRRLWELFRIGKCFLTVVLIHVHIIAAIQLVRIVELILAENRDKETATYTIIILVSLVFLGYFAFDGSVNGNKFEVWTFVFSNFILCLVVTIEFIVRAIPNDTLDGEVRLDALDFIKLLVCIVAFFIYVMLAPKISKEIAWRMYLRIGAKTSLRKMYATYQFFLTMWKQDLEFVVVIFSMWGPLGVFDPKTDYEFYMSFVGFACSIILSFFLVLIIRREMGLCFIFVIVLMLVEPLYIAFRVARFFQNPYEKYTVKEVPVRPFAIIAIVHIIVRLFLIASAFASFFNFRKGLRQEVFQARSRKRSRRRAAKRSRNRRSFMREDFDARSSSQTQQEDPSATTRSTVREMHIDK